MLYVEEVLDRRTGELVSVSKGEWITLNELATSYGVGPRKARSILRRLDFLQLTGAESQHPRHVLAPWAAERGLGRTNRATGNGFSFVVISPKGREWIDHRWKDALQEHEAEVSAKAATAGEALEAFKVDRCREDMTTPEAVSWLAHFWPDLSQAEMATILEVSQQYLSKFLRAAERRRERLREAVKADLPEKASGPRLGFQRDPAEEPR